MSLADPHNATEAPALDKAPIIVRLPNWIGDVCMCLPSLTALQQSTHPLILCGRPWAQALTEQFHPAQFVPITGKFMADRRAIAQIPKQVRQAALGLIMPDSLSSAALFAVNGIASCGYCDDGRSLLLRHASRKPDHPVHAVQKWWLLTKFALRQWHISVPSGAQDVPPKGKLEITDADQQQAQQALQNQQLSHKPFVLLAPTATGQHHGKVKVWPHFGALAQALQSQGFKVVMCPPPQEREQAKAACPEAELLDPLPLTAFCALTRLASLVVCNDSGVSHLAAISGANQLTLFGVTDPRHTGPWSDHAHRLGTLGQWPTLAQVIDRIAQIMPQTHTPNEASATTPTSASSSAPDSALNLTSNQASRYES